MHRLSANVCLTDEVSWVSSFVQAFTFRGQTPLVSKKVDFCRFWNETCRSLAFQCCKSGKKENWREADMETAVQEECGIPIVPLWGADLFQGYQGTSMHFPPSPWAAAKLLSWPSSTADPVSSKPYMEESESVPSPRDHLLALPEPLLLMTKVSWKLYSGLWLLSVLTFSFHSSPSLGDLIPSSF